MATGPFASANDPSQLAGMNPGNNLAGGSVAGFLTPNAIPAMGGPTPPFASGPVPAGSSMPAYSSPYAPGGATSALANLQNNFGSSGPTPGHGNTNVDLAKGFQSAGFSGGVGTALSQFLSTGAGYNPAVAQAMIAALQPQFAKGQANLMEQFGSMGLGMGSPAALAMGDYQAQENLDVGTILSKLYEDSVQNYMQVLINGKGEPQQQGGGVMGALGGILGGLGGAVLGPAGSAIGSKLGGWVGSKI
jgi:hypothetical protein